MCSTLPGRARGVDPCCCGASDGPGASPCVPSPTACAGLVVESVVLYRLYRHRLQQACPPRTRMLPRESCNGLSLHWTQRAFERPSRVGRARASRLRRRNRGCGIDRVRRALAMNRSFARPPQPCPGRIQGINPLPSRPSCHALYFRIWKGDTRYQVAASSWS
jgi:hypothetical protein